MTSKAYQLPETALQWLNTGGDAVLLLTSVAAAAGRQGALHDFGTAAKQVLTGLMVRDLNTVLKVS